MESILANFSSPDLDQVTEAFNLALQVLVEIGKRSGSQDTGDAGFEYPVKALHHILDRIFAGDGLEHVEALDELLRMALESFGDIRYHTYQIIPELARDHPESIGRLIWVLGSLDPESKFRRSLVPLPASITKKDPVRSRPGHRAAFSACWLGLLGRVGKDDVSNHKRILSILDDRIIPYMTRPQMLIDYLTAAYEAGGMLSLLSLSSLFTLIRKHNLDYPQFFTRLYALLDGRVLHVAYRRRFLRLLETFMQSTMMPAWLIAAFAKRMCRLALYAPAPCLQWVVPFVYNLLKRHPVCRVMIHRETEGQTSITDPYDAAEPDPAKSRAIDSCLWELHALTQHHWGPVARQAAMFEDRFTKPPMDLGKILDTLPMTYEEIIEAELGHRWSKRPPTAIDMASTAF